MQWWAEDRGWSSGPEKMVAQGKKDGTRGGRCRRDAQGPSPADSGKAPEETCLEGAERTKAGQRDLSGTNPGEASTELAQAQDLPKRQWHIYLHARDQE
ncbi:UNVERIFIED_CONTAM: hypothetical protein K2H54_059410 [Gekko kuhli]